MLQPYFPSNLLFKNKSNNIWKSNLVAQKTQIGRDWATSQPGASWYLSLLSLSALAYTPTGREASGNQDSCNPTFRICGISWECPHLHTCPHARPQTQTSKEASSFQRGSFGSFIIGCKRPISHKLSWSLWSLAYSPSQTLLHSTKVSTRNYYLVDLKQPCTGKHADLQARCAGDHEKLSPNRCLQK